MTWHERRRTFARPRRRALPRLGYQRSIPRMALVGAERLYKAYWQRVAVADISFRVETAECIEDSKGRIALHPSQPSARRVYQPAVLR